MRSGRAWCCKPAHTVDQDGLRHHRSGPGAIGRGQSAPEDAAGSQHITLDDVAMDIVGVSGRRMLRAPIDGTTDAAAVAALA
jgi:hypothetical protein